MVQQFRRRSTGVQGPMPRLTNFPTRIGVRPLASPKSTAHWLSNEFVQEHIARSAQYVYNVAASPQCLFGLESPLEAAFDVWWRALSMTSRINGYELMLIPQKEAQAAGRTYRLDFAIEPDGMKAHRAYEVGVTVPLLCIELDGHDFHERTKEQVAYRNQRDRDLSAAGWQVLHFSGTEFHRDPEKCVLEANAAACRLFSWDWECLILEAESRAGIRQQ